MKQLTTRTHDRVTTLLDLLRDRAEETDADDAADMAEVLYLAAQRPRYVAQAVRERGVRHCATPTE